MLFLYLLTPIQLPWRSLVLIFLEPVCQDKLITVPEGKESIVPNSKFNQTASTALEAFVEPFDAFGASLLEFLENSMELVERVTIPLFEIFEELVGWEAVVGSASEAKCVQPTLSIDRPPIQ